MTGQCDKSHHPLYNGTSKDVVFGITCPPEMQRDLAHALRDTDPGTKIVTMVVNVGKEDDTELQGELETMRKLDAIDPAGEFTAKLYYEQVLEPRRKWLHGAFCNAAIDTVMQKLLKDDSSASLLRHYALDGCDCGSGLHEVMCCYTHPRACDCQRCNYEKMRLHMHEWSTQPVRLHYIFMQFAGESIEKLVRDSLSEKTLRDGFQRLLTHYITLYRHGISHLDLHDANLTWAVEGATRLKIKIIDFGCNHMHASKGDEVYTTTKQGRDVIDVTKWYTNVCNVSEKVRWWHPVEYPMFHLCATLLLAPLLLPGNRWTRQDHANKVLQLATLAPATVVQEGQIFDYAHVTAELRDFFGTCPLHVTPGRRTQQCSRQTFFHDVSAIFENIRRSYKLIHQHLQQVWVRVCSIVGTDISRTHFLPCGNPHSLTGRASNDCWQGVEMFSGYRGYHDTLDVFRTQYYHCQHLDIATVEREFDTFSLAMVILKKSTQRDVALRRAVHTHLLSSDSFERNQTKLADAVEELRLASSGNA